MLAENHMKRPHNKPVSITGGSTESSIDAAYALLYLSVPAARRSIIKLFAVIWPTVPHNVETKKICPPRATTHAAPRTSLSNIPSFGLIMNTLGGNDPMY